MLIDTSVWIDFVRKSGSDWARAVLTRELSAHTAVFTCPTRFELLANCARARERDLLEDLLAMCRHEPFLPQDWQAASEAGFALARHGQRVPSFDLLVAAVAVRTGERLLTLDAHFAVIQKLAMPQLEMEGKGSHDDRK